MAAESRDAYANWYVDEYKKAVNVEDAIKHAGSKTVLGKALGNLSYWHSSIWRLDSLHLLKYNVPFERTGFTTTAFRVTNPEVEEPNSFVYALLYSSVVKGKVVHHYATVYPTLVSKDGEYRSGLVKYEQLCSIREEYMDQYSIAEEFISGQLQKGTLHVQRDTMFPPTMRDRERALITDALEERHALLLLVLHWITGALRDKAAVIENHVVPNYGAIVLTDGWELVYNRLREEKIETTPFPAVVFRLTTQYRRPAEKAPTEIIGQKITLLSLAETQQPEDEEYPSWREIRVAKYVSDLAINGICASVPVYGDFFLVGGVTQGLFDNSDSKDRVDDIPTVRGTLSALSNIRGTLPNSTTGTYRFSSRIMELQKVSLRDTLASSYAICSVTEAVGRTWGDLFSMLTGFVFARRQLGPLLEDPWMMRRYLFDISFAALMLQTRVGAMHADLHLNNCTLFGKLTPWKTKDDAPALEVPRPRVLYRLGDAFYLFPHYGRTAALIDFSRAVAFPPVTIPGVSEPTAEDHGDPLVPPMGTFELERFLLRQKARADALLHQILPDFQNDHRDQLSYAYFQHPQEVLRALSCADVLRFTTSLQRLLDHAPRAVQVAPAIKSLLADLGRRLADRTRADLLRLISASAPQGDSGSLGLYEVMQEFFREDRCPAEGHKGGAGESESTTGGKADSAEDVLSRYVPGWDDPEDKTFTLIDYLSSRNPLRYGTRQEKHFPPQLDVPKLRKYLKTLDPSSLPGYEFFRQATKAAPGQLAAVAAEAAADSDSLLGLSAKQQKPSKRDSAASEAEIGTFLDTLST